MDQTKQTNSKSNGTKMHSFETRVDIPEDVRKKLVTLLNQQLANTFDLYSQAKQAHWNVKGMNFYQLHLLYDEVAEMVFPYVDMIAERATAIGGMALGTARMAAGSSELPEYPDAINGPDTLRAMVERFAVAANSAREAVDKADDLEDKDTSDLLTGYSRDLDKALWFIEAHLQNA